MATNAKIIEYCERNLKSGTPNGQSNYIKQMTSNLRASLSKRSTNQFLKSIDNAKALGLIQTPDCDAETVLAFINEVNKAKGV